MRLKMKTKEIVAKNIKWIILFVCIFVTVLIAEDVMEKEIMKIDTIGYKIMSEHIISEEVTPIAKVITEFGGAIFLITLSIILLIVIKNKKIGILIWINLAISTIINQVLKNIIQRPRPTEFRIINQNGYSFPSGHSMASMTFYGFLIYLIYKKVKNKYLKWTLISLLSILIILVGASRVYLGVHYTSDVIAGILISTSYLIMFTSIAKKYLE